MQIVFLGDNLHEMSKPIFGENKLGDNLHESQNLFSGKIEKKIFKMLSAKIFTGNAKC